MLIYLFHFIRVKNEFFNHAYGFFILIKVLL